ncbi:hypothetical protein WJ30_11660 [Burkholderia diffusa]|nr:hypothetical protein WJ30_11660 [Burkholderia diffusa]
MRGQIFRGRLVPLKRVIASLYVNGRKIRKLLRGKLTVLDKPFCVSKMSLIHILTMRQSGVYTDLRACIA